MTSIYSKQLHTYETSASVSQAEQRKETIKKRKETQDQAKGKGNEMKKRKVCAAANEAGVESQPPTNGGDGESSSSSEESSSSSEDENNQEESSSSESSSSSEGDDGNEPEKLLPLHNEDGRSPGPDRSGEASGLASVLPKGHFRFSEAGCAQRNNKEAELTDLPVAPHAGAAEKIDSTEQVSNPTPKRPKLDRLPQSPSARGRGRGQTYLGGDHRDQVRSGRNTGRQSLLLHPNIKDYSSVTAFDIGTRAPKAADRLAYRILEMQEGGPALSSFKVRLTVVVLLFTNRKSPHQEATVVSYDTATSVVSLRADNTDFLPLDGTRLNEEDDKAQLLQLAVDIPWEQLRDVRLLSN